MFHQHKYFIGWQSRIGDRRRARHRQGHRPPVCRSRRTRCHREPQIGSPRSHRPGVFRICRGRSCPSHVMSDARINWNMSSARPKQQFGPDRHPGQQQRDEHRSRTGIAGDRRNARQDGRGEHQVLSAAGESHRAENDRTPEPAVRSSTLRRSPASSLSRAGCSTVSPRPAC